MAEAGAPADPVDPERVRCSSWARSVDLSPSGTIGSQRGYLLVEVPLPWPRDVGEIAALSELGPVLSPRNIRLQAVVPRSADVPAADRPVVLYIHPEEPTPDGGPPWFGGYRRLSLPAGDSLASTVGALVAEAEHGSGTGPAGEPPATSVLVCTHGRRDVCCGSLGTDLALQLAARGAPEGTEYLRTSHTGGHRFAATFVALPEGTAWAYSTVDLVDDVLGRRVDFGDVAGHYRGCAGLGGPEAQIVEREALVHDGWALLDRPRRAFPTGEVSPTGRLFRLEAARPGGGVDSWEAVVAPGRRLPVPDCMGPLAEARKSETEWTVTEFRSV
jgi:hypothetical protein